MSAPNKRSENYTIRNTDDSTYVSVHDDTADDYFDLGYVRFKTEDLHYIEDTLHNAEETKYPKAELLLFFASLFAGALVSGFISGFNLKSVLSIVLLVIYVGGAVGCFVAYFFVRSNQAKDISELSKEILSRLPKTKDSKKTDLGIHNTSNGEM